MQLEVKNLYSKNDFDACDISLSFIKTNPIAYKQYGNQFIPWLSIIDVLMFNNKKKVIDILNQYELI